MNGNPKLRERYLEEVQLYLWHQSSKFSIFQGAHKSKELSNRYLNMAQSSYEEYLQSTQQNKIQ
jgi:hypothetical protein